MRAWVVLTLLFAGCPRPSPHHEPTAPAVAQSGPVAEAGRALVARFECNRCHDGTGLDPAPRDRHCVRCHRDVLDGKTASPLLALARWKGSITSLRAVPSLAAAGRKLRREWVRDFLRAPHDLRPALPATMPRLEMSAADAEALAAYLVPSEAPAIALDASLAADGERLYRALRCGTCHRFRGASVDGEAGAPAAPPRDPPGDAQLLAPDLAVTRDRFQRGALVEWLLDPQELDGDSAMPRFDLTRAQATALAAFLVTTPLTPPAATVAPARLPLLARPVAWSEVRDRGFHKTCWHCHAAPDEARGDGGPGDSGGLGFRKRGLDLSTRATIAAGSLDDAGHRRSVTAPLGDGTPLLVAHLLARQAEEAGHPTGGVRGMPLALPACSPEDVQLVASWIAQGMPE